MVSRIYGLGGLRVEERMRQRCLLDLQPEHPLSFFVRFSLWLFPSPRDVVVACSMYLGPQGTWLSGQFADS